MPTPAPRPSFSRDFCIILVTCQSKKEAGRIASSLLKERLTACANTMPGIDSRFWWNGKVESAKEILLMLKTKRSNFKKVEKEIKRLHSYEVPEIIALPIIAGSAEYLGWIACNVK
ncbi:MAG: divalent-cation tolerance protein CutA [Candidatus Omnitrophica bacterium]|nr:divalent-cation tolerance protein CutA [Candidatus Omnitrophota bacterium]